MGKNGPLRLGRMAAAASILVCASAGSDRTPYSIDDFEGPAALQGWRFYSSPAPPATGGSLALGSGHREHGAVLTYRLHGGYAEALWSATSSLPKRRNPAISLWIRFSPEVEVYLVAKDSSGQTLRFPIPAATIEHPKAGDWQYMVVPLAAKEAGRIKGRLVEIGILVQSGIQASAEGRVSFDEVRLREYSETFYLDAAAQVTAPSKESLELAPRLGVNIHLLRDSEALDLARAAGFGFVRMDMLWANVEQSGRYRFFAYDALLRALEARDMGALWILDYGHPDHGGATPRTPQDVAAFGRFAEAAAAYFKGRKVRYEVWNEPNIAQFWTPSPNVSEYAALLREAVAAIHRADPSAQVSSGGVSRMDAAFLSRAVDPGLAAQLSAVAVHPYPKAGPESIAAELALFREWAARALGDHVEIWNTEWGYSSSNAPREAPSNGHTEAGRRRQAVLAVREMLTVWTAGFPLAVWYDLRDDGADPANPEHNYGLLDSSGKEKPAMKAIRTLTSTVKDRKFAGMIQETPAGIHAMRLDGSPDTVFIVWNDQPGERRPVEYDRRGMISATDLMGNPVKSKDVGSGRARLEIDEATGPIYLHWTTGAASYSATLSPLRQDR